jgi:hypothetical protein
VELDRKTQGAFETMIDDSIVKRYDGDLDRLGEGRHGETCYRPLDTDRIRRLLVDLWGNLLTPETINEAFDRLMEEQDDWPHGYCEEDEEARPLSSYGPD